MSSYTRSIIVGFALILTSMPSQAYVGPGLGLGVLGALLGVILAVILGVFGLFWYPLKRIFGRSDEDDEDAGDDKTDSSETKD